MAFSSVRDSAEFKKKSVVKKLYAPSNKIDNSGTCWCGNMLILELTNVMMKLMFMHASTVLTPRNGSFSEILERITIMPFSAQLQCERQILGKLFFQQARERNLRMHLIISFYAITLALYRNCKLTRR